MGCTASKSTDAVDNNNSFNTKAPEDVVNERDANSSKGDNSIDLEEDPVENRIGDMVTPDTSSRRSSKSKQIKNNDYSVIQMTDFVESCHYEDTKIFKGVYVNQLILCKDEFFSKYTDQKMYRWRKAEIIAVEGEDHSRVLIHFVGWADSFDQWFDLHSEWFKCAPVWLLNKAECDKGVDLSDSQQKVVTEFLFEGEQNFGQNLREEGTSPSLPVSGKGSRASGVTYSVGQMVEHKLFCTNFSVQ
jgi:hypothetical protein